MKKKDIKGFTLVEIMIVVVIIGLMASLSIPYILGAYANAQENAKARNIAEVEKAKAVLTLPTLSGITGAMALMNTTTVLDTDPEARSNLLAALSISDKNELKVGKETIVFGTISERATYRE